jgi:hypothetical protein
MEFATLWSQIDVPSSTRVAQGAESPSTKDNKSVDNGKPPLPALLKTGTSTTDSSKLPGKDRSPAPKTVALIGQSQAEPSAPSSSSSSSSSSRPASSSLSSSVLTSTSSTTQLLDQLVTGLDISRKHFPVDRTSRTNNFSVEQNMYVRDMVIYTHRFLATHFPDPKAMAEARSALDGRTDQLIFADTNATVQLATLDVVRLSLGLKTCGAFANATKKIWADVYPLVQQSIGGRYSSVPNSVPSSSRSQPSPSSSYSSSSSSTSSSSSSLSSSSSTSTSSALSKTPVLDLLVAELDRQRRGFPVGSSSHSRRFTVGQHMYIRDMVVFARQFLEQNFTDRQSYEEARSALGDRLDQLIRGDTNSAIQVATLDVVRLGIGLKSNGGFSTLTQTIWDDVRPLLS